MEWFKLLLGVLMLIGGIALGLYVGIWVMFIGGIVGLVNAVVLLAGGTVAGMLIGISILKIMFAGLVGYLSAVALILPAMGVLSTVK